MSRRKGKRASEVMPTKSPGTRAPLNPKSTSMLYIATGALTAMYAPTEGAAAREVAASAAREMNEESAMCGVYPGASASTRSGSASAAGVCGAWMAWRTMSMRRD
jgi:hypothetical protein